MGNVELRLERFNSLSSDEAQTELLKCCGASKWANRIAAQRPFETLDHLMQTAERVWWSLDRRDWLEAFRSHPKIGEKKAEAQTTAAAQKWSEEEQSGVDHVATKTSRELAELNHQYEEKFGYIFIVCATGKSSEELLSLLRERVSNDSQKELRIAAAEQAKITELRLGKLLNQ